MTTFPDQSLLIYQNEEGNIRISAHIEEKTIWMAHTYDKPESG